MEKQKKYLLNRCNCGKLFNIDRNGSFCECGENGELLVNRATKEEILSKFKEKFSSVDHKDFGSGFLIYSYEDEIRECVSFAVRVDSFGPCLWSDELDYWSLDTRTRFDLKKKGKRYPQHEASDAAFIDGFTIVPFLDSKAS